MNCKRIFFMPENYFCFESDQEFEDNHEFNVDEKTKNKLKNILIFDEDILSYFDVPLIFSLRNHDSEDCFISYLLCGPDSIVLEYLLVKKPISEFEKYRECQIDLKSLLLDSKNGDRFILKHPYIYSDEKISVNVLDEDTFLKYLSILADDILND